MNTSHINIGNLGPAALFALFTFIIVAAFTPAATAGGTLADVLLEKGIITKEDWTRIQRAEQQRRAADRPTIEDRRAADTMILNMVEKRAAEDRRGRADNGPPVTVNWGDKGFSLATGDGLFRTTLQWRFQGRWTYPERSDPLTPEAFEDNAESSFELRRVRMKIGGHGYRPWVKYYFEVELQSGRDFDDDAADAATRLIDWRITLDKYPWAGLRIGQWKIDYNRERVDSSGKQTFVERSIVNRPFTIDRQIGAMLSGRLNPGTPADVNYYAGVFSGGGRGLARNDDDNMMYVGRLQWNVFGRELKWRQSDTAFHTTPTASASVGGYTTIGTCTRWSSGGCGGLGELTRPGNAADGQFRVEGVQVGSAFKYRGFAWQHENHWKQVRDAGNAGRESNLFGGYFQAGYFPHSLIPLIPKPLEAAFRYAYVDSEVVGFDDFRQEWTGALNWFFAGHRNKLTLDASYLTLNRAATDTIINDAGETSGRFSEQRVRLQWDVSF